MNKRRSKWRIKAIILSIFLILPFSFTGTEAKTFKVASYNVENLFDLTKDGTEYIEYIPNNRYGWNKGVVDIKVANIAEVIKDMGADVVALQEIESKKALFFLQDKLRGYNIDYPYVAIADSKATPVKCAVISKFPIIKKEEIQVDKEFSRNILKVTLNIDGNNLILFVNHWKSKRGPESWRVSYAKALRREINRLKEGMDFILAGDFNANYNEYKTFLNSSKLNDTAGKTGINHILKTVKNTEMVNEKILTEQPGNEYLYNLWLEINKQRRWSYNFLKYKDGPDNIIVPKELYDQNGISYVDNSFDKFDRDYLFRKNTVYRWQREKRGRGKHLGRGYSDHLPVFASFSTEPFHLKNNDSVFNDTSPSKSKKINLSKGLLDLNTATEKELQSINGIGPVLSEKIIAGRPYKSVEELITVKGIGPKRLKRFRRYFVIGKE